MQSELQGLEITKGEIKYLSGIGIDQVYRPATWKKFFKEGCKTLIIFTLILISYGILSIVFQQHHPFLILIHVVVALGTLIDDLYKIFLTVRNPNLLKIFDKVSRYNSIVKMIMLHDDLEEVGNSEVKIYQREQVISALNFIRSDLVRALKTAKIIRKNHQLITENPELQETDLSLRMIPLNPDETTEQGRLLSESIQLAKEVHQKLKQLQQKKSDR